MLFPNKQRKKDSLDLIFFHSYATDSFCIIYLVYGDSTISQVTTVLVQSSYLAADLFGKLYLIGTLEYNPVAKSKWTRKYIC